MLRTEYCSEEIITVLWLFKLQTEHTEGVRKLTFVVSLVDAILEVVSARGTPFTVLAESVAIRQVSCQYDGSRET